MNQNDTRLLKAISQLENRISLLERKQYNEVVSVATCTEDVALTAGVQSPIPYNYFYANQGIYYNEDEKFWVCMSAGIYSIGMTFGFSANVTDVLVRMYIATEQTTYPNLGYLVQSVGNGVNRSLHATSFCTPYVLEEGWTFRFSIQTNVTCNLAFRNYQFVQWPTPMISIVQIASNYDFPAETNEWYYEPNEVEPR